MPEETERKIQEKIDEAYGELLRVEEGDNITVKIIDFKNTRHPREKNPRTITGEVTNINNDVSYGAGEIKRTVRVDDPWQDGCYIDCGDTSRNGMVSSPLIEKYTKAWRPRAGKDRLLLGRITEVNKDD